MNELLNTLTDTAGNQIVRLLMALAVLVAGWLVALLIAAIVRAILKRTEIDNRLAAWVLGGAKEPGDDDQSQIDVERWVARIVFWILMLFVIVAFFEVLGLTMISEPINRFLIKIFEYLPNLIGPAILLVVAWAVATGLRFIVRKVLDATQLDERLQQSAGMDDEKAVPVAKTIGDSVYWLVFLLFLPAILSALNLQGLLQPVQGMIDKVLAFLPNLFAALLILAAGWLLARVIQRVVTNLLAALGADRLSEQVGLSTALGEQRLSNLVGIVLYVLILIPVLVASLNALKMDAITHPASQMLQTILAALPLVFAAALVLLLAFVVGRVVAGLVTNLLTGVGFNSILVRLGIGKEVKEDQTTPSELGGKLVLAGVMLFATIEAVRMLGFDVLAELIAEFLVFAGHVFLGLVIFGIGLFLANLAARTIEAGASSQARLFALAARVSILVLAGAMALRQMGLANEIITVAFGLLLGAVAVATAIAFGIGGRQLAEDTLRRWHEKAGIE